MFSRSERRRDPEDGRVYTLAELKQKYAGDFTPQEAEEYWRDCCEPVEPGAPPPPGNVQGASPGVVQLQNDPFLTHTTSQPRGESRRDVQPQGGERGERAANVREDPFMTHNQAATSAAGAREPADVRADPFLTHEQHLSQPVERPDAGQHRNRRQELLQMAHELESDVRHWTEALKKLMGPGDPERNDQDRSVLIAVPLIIFVWTVCMWCFLQHYSKDACDILTGVMGLACIVFFLLHGIGFHPGGVSLFTLGVLTLIAVGAGTAVGTFSYERHWRQYWWLLTGQEQTGLSAATPAFAMGDAALLDFAASSGGPTVDHTAVDDVRSAGYKDGIYYCAAPILSTTTADASLVKVNYWAIGVGCCEELGTYVCDDSREYGSTYGVVMLGHGFPCPSCNNERFERAVRKAEAMHGLVSAPGAVYVRWVKDPGSVKVTTLLQGLEFLIIIIVLAGLLFVFLGLVCWYYGIGKMHGQSTEDALLEAKMRGLMKQMM